MFHECGKEIDKRRKVEGEREKGEEGRRLTA